MGDRDKGYKKLFSNKEMVRDLLTEFVDPAIVADLDLGFAGVVREHTDFVTDDIRERIDDIIWRVRFRGSELYLCILVEFQSSEDRWMAPRVLSYLGLLYEDIAKRDLLVDGMLPPVLPIVLHTGSRPWKSPCTLQALVAPVSPVLARYAPAIEFLLLDAASYEDERLAGSENLAAFLMRMERSRQPEDLVEEIRGLCRVLRRETSAHLRRAFTIFVTSVLLPKKTGKGDFPDVSDLAEVERMILEGKPDWAEAWLKEGEERGRKLGEERGMRLGERLGEERTKRENALRMLEGGLPVSEIAKFVDLPEEEVRRIAADTRH